MAMALGPSIALYVIRKGTILAIVLDMHMFRRHTIFAALLFVGLSMSSLFSEARDLNFMCRAFYDNSMFSNQTVYSGVLTELANGEQSLVYLPNSWGPGHQVALDRVIAQHADSNPVVKVLWMGELALHEIIGKKPILVAVNEVSGTYFKSTQNPKDGPIPLRNDVHAMQAYLNKNNVWDISQTKYVPYKVNEAHLDWKAEYLKQTLGLSNTSHDINNVFHMVKMSTKLALMDREKFAPLLRRSLTENFLKTVQVLSKESIFNKEVTSRLLYLSNMYVRHGEFTLPQLQEFSDLTSKFLAQWKQYSESLYNQIQII
jgi:hypothetical protein